MDITAVRTMWGDGIPAFVITITPHIEVANYTFHKIIRGNLTDDSYEVVKPEPGEFKDIGEKPETLSGYLKWFPQVICCWKMTGKDLRDSLILIICAGS